MAMTICSFCASWRMMAAICSALFPAPSTTSGNPVRCARQLSTWAKSSTCRGHTAFVINTITLSFVILIQLG